MSWKSCSATSAPTSNRGLAGEETTTEDLRQALRRYRSFFDRLSATYLPDREPQVDHDLQRDRRDAAAPAVINA
jgi:hypothetical protein